MNDPVDIYESPRQKSSNAFIFTISAIKELVFYPLTMCGNLVKLGYIPKELYLEKRELNNTIYEIPSRITIVKKMFTDEGIFGFTRGIWLNLMSFAIHKSVLLTYPNYMDELYLTYNNNIQINKYLYKYIKLCTTHSFAVILSHPFEVLSTIQVAQYIGKETIYSGFLITPFIQLFENKGLSGYYGGIIPRLLSCLFVQVTVESVSLLLNWCLGGHEISYINNSQQENELHSYLIKYKKLSIRFAQLITMILIEGSVKSFEVLETNYAVMNSGILAGMEPFIFVNNSQAWTDNLVCCNRLAQLERKVNLVSKLFVTNPKLFVPY